MFINEESLLEIKVHWRKIGRTTFSCLSDQSFKELGEESEEAKKYKSLAVQMKPLTWQIFNALQDEATIVDHEGSRKFSYRIYKEARLKKLVVSWDAIDEQDKPVPVSVPNLNRLSPQIAETILDTYDEMSFLSEDEEGN